MESTLFTTLTPNEEANLSGGTKASDLKLSLKLIKVAVAKNTVTQKATGGNGGNGGAITIGGGKKAKDSPVVIVDSKFNSSGGNGGDAINSSNNAVGAGN